MGLIIEAASVIEDVRSIQDSVANSLVVQKAPRYEVSRNDGSSLHQFDLEGQRRLLVRGPDSWVHDAPAVPEDGLVCGEEFERLDEDGQYNL